MKPGGVFLFNIWDSVEHNHLIRTVDKTVAEQLPESPPDFFDTPYGYHDIDVIKNLLYESGFGELEISVLPRISKAETAQHVALGFVLVVHLQIEKDAPDSLSDIVDAVEHAVQRRSDLLFLFLSPYSKVTSGSVSGVSQNVIGSDRLRAAG